MHDGIAEPIITVDRLSVRYGRHEALTDVSFTVDDGELIAVVGPNGAGKSTLFRAILGLLPYDGTVVVHRQHHRRSARAAVAFVPQRAEIELDFPITVGQAVGTARRAFRRFGRRPRTTDRIAVRRALARVDLDGFAGRPIGQLSGGQLQRVLLARALAQEPDVLLLDEPLSGLDRASSDALHELLGELAADGTAILVATHDLAAVHDRFPRCLGLNGTLVADGTPTIALDGAALARFFRLPTTPTLAVSSSA